jgi:1-acyl-sn-glycerol-3-phosphate acyltransferase
MKAQLRDRKSAMIYAIFSTINKIAIRFHFRKVQVEGTEYLPKDGPFLLIGNHTSRWDGLLAYHLINRPANFMVSPNELLGLQGHILGSMGSFPANARFDLIAHMQRQIRKNEPIVIFPEGDTYRDGTTHRFKNGAARLTLSSAQQNLNFPVIPMAVRYSEDGHAVTIKLAPPIELQQYTSANNQVAAVQGLTARMHREVCHLKYELGHHEDAALLFAGAPPKWAA